MFLGMEGSPVEPVMVGLDELKSGGLILCALPLLFPDI